MKSNFLLALMGQVFLIFISTQSPIYRRQTANQNYLDTICESVRADCSTNSIANCTSLKEALAVTYNRAGGVHLSADTPYYIFSVFELFYSGLISDEGIPEANMLNAHLESAAVESMSRRGCTDILDRIKLSKRDTDACQWSYTCKYNPHYFPSFTVKAKLDDSLSVPHRCSNIKMSNIKFVRTTCEANPEEDHWCRCDAGRITTGYKLQS